jgi:TRAP-type C4-dicarboxylate transport system permease small subunit
MNRWVGIFCVAVFALMVVTVFTQATLRYVFQYTVSWAGELARYLQIWLTYLGACLAFERLGHVNISFFVDKLPPLIHLIVSLFAQFVTLIFLIFLIYKGSFLVKVGWIMHSTAMDIPMSCIYAAAPLSSIFMFLNVSSNIIEYIKRYRKTD